MRIVLGIVAGIFLCGCQPIGASYTLYRNSVVDARLRIHVASFDAAESDPYNQENCRTAADLFAQQPGVSVRYWCEKGAFLP